MRIFAIYHYMSKGIADHNTIRHWEPIQARQMHTRPAFDRMRRSASPDPRRTLVHPFVTANSSGEVLQSHTNPMHA